VRLRRLLVAIIAGIVVTVIVFESSLVRARDEELVSVAVAARDLPARTALREQDVRRVELPRRLVPAGALTEGVALRVVRDPVYEGEVVSVRHIMGPNEIGASALIPPGKSYAFNLPASLFFSAPPRLQLHDRIDIVGWQKGRPLETGGVVLADLEIIDLSPSFSDNASESRYLTIGASAEEIVRLLALREGYALAIALRPFLRVGEAR